MKDQGTRILLIEDDADDAFLIRENLGEVFRDDTRFRVRWAKTLGEGLKALASEPVDVVIVDLLVSEIGGFDAVLRLRTEAPSVPIVVLTALDDEYAALEALSHGAQDYLVKGSIDAQTLIRSIRHAIERSQLLTRLEQSSEDRFLKIIEKSADAMAVIDGEGVVRFVNPASLLLFETRLDEIVGKPFPFPLRENPLTEMEIPLRDGGRKIVQMRLSDIEWEKKPAKLASIRDITTLQKVEGLMREIREQKRLDKMKDEFISTVSHELRTPLTTIKSAVENLQDGISGPLNEKQERVLTIANRNVDRLSRIINDLLDLSRLESGKAWLQKKRVDVVPLLQETVQNFQLTARAKRLAMEGLVPKGLPPVYADPDLLVQVLNNLLDNALRFAKSRVVVEARVVRQDVEVTVSDDGPGIPEDKMKSLFTKFVQLDRPMGGEGYKGTGLGLAICKEIIDRHGGRIWAVSRPGEWTQFHLAMRRYKDETDFREILLQTFRGMDLGEGHVALFLVSVEGKDTNSLAAVGEKIRRQVLRKGDVLIDHPARNEMIAFAATTPEGAGVMRQRMGAALESAPFYMAMRLYPDDGEDPEMLIRNLLEGSRHDRHEKDGRKTP